VFSGTNNGNTRGLHYAQGAYYVKNWGKHGPLTNPYAFGFFKHMESEGDSRRFAQAFTLYESDLFPPSFHRRLVAANSLHNIVWQSDLIPDGSTFRTKDRDPLLQSSDRWFRPVFSCVGPDGGIYLADWYDTRLSHLSPVDDWHKTSGRIYRVRPVDRPFNAWLAGDLAKASSDELVQNFSSDNKWLRHRSVLELGWRKDKSIKDQLRRMVEEKGSLEAIWTLHLLDSIDDSVIESWLTHKDPHVRRWAIRLLGDGTLSVDPNRWADFYESWAVLENDVEVRSQWASTAKRLPADSSLAILRGLIQHDDRSDAYLPLLIWWALESQMSDSEFCKSFLASAEVWDNPLVRDEILHRMMKRYAIEETEAAFRNAEQLLTMAPDQGSRDDLLRGLNEAFQGRSIPQLPSVLEKALGDYRKGLGQHELVLRLQQGGAEAIRDAINAIKKNQVSEEVRAQLVECFGLQPSEKAIPVLLGLATGRSTNLPSLQRSAIGALAAYSDAQIATKLLDSFSKGISKEQGVRDAACRTLASRREWALLLVEEVNQWRVRASDIPPDVLQRLRAFDDGEVKRQVDHVFGVENKISSEDQAKRIRGWLEMLTPSAASSAREVDFKNGASIYANKCGTCHRLYDRGNLVGPTLDGYARNDPKFWLTAVADPSLEIREGYQSFRALMDDGRVLTGMVTARNPKTISLRTADQKTVVLARQEIELFEPLKTSLMPSGLMDDLSEEQIRDLMGYLMSDSDPLALN
ncbi:MAG: c-type cytochrome, partial [Planctomycetota bacterium]